MGRIYKRGEIWWAEWHDATGDRHRRTCRTKDRAVARDRLRQFELAPPDLAPHQTLERALTYFVDVACAPRSPGTIRCYRQKACHLARLFGADSPVRGIKRADVQGYIATRLGEGANRGTVHKELVVLRSTLREAGVDASVVPRFETAYRPRARHLTPLEYGALLTQLVPARQLWVTVAVYTGARLGELLRLEWRHVDFERGWIHLPGTKTAHAFRTIPLHEPLRPWLEAWADGAEPGPVVEPWLNYRRDLAAACKRAGIAPVTANDLRRTFASWMKQAGVDSLAVAHLLGHSSTRMVELVYGRLNPSVYQAAVASLPRCATGVPDPVRISAPPGTPGTALRRASAGNVVPRVGVEPTTRGFSGRAHLRVVRDEDS